MQDEPPSACPCNQAAHGSHVCRALARLGVFARGRAPAPARFILAVPLQCATDCFCIEAYLNHAGAATFRCGLILIDCRLGRSSNCFAKNCTFHSPEGTGAQPLQTVATLFNFRNTLAHGRSQELMAKPVLRTTEDYYSAYQEQLLTDWEALIQTEDFAARARDDVRSVLERLHAGRRDEKEYLFTFGIGLHGASLVQGP
jgi:hypothetical protein